MAASAGKQALDESDDDSSIHSQAGTGYIGSDSSLKRLNVLLMCVGSLGDILPFIAIARELQQGGHRPRIATHLLFRSIVEKEGLEFFDIGGDPAELMSYMVRNPGLLPSYSSAIKGDLRQKRRTIRGMMERCWLSCFSSEDQQPSRSRSKSLGTPRPFVAEAIMANPPSFAHIHCAQKLGVPLHVVFT